MDTANPTITTGERYLDDLAHLIAREGVDPFESDIARLVVRLRAASACATLIDVLSDHHASRVARQRAFGMLVGQLAKKITGCTDIAA